MKKTLCRAAALMLALLLCVSAFPAYAAAADETDYRPAVSDGEPGRVTAYIPMTLVIKGSAPQKEREYSFKLTPLDGAPDPNLSENVEKLTDEDGNPYFRMTISVSGTTDGIRAEWNADFDTVGVYHYTLEQITAEKYSRCSYDKRVFHITVTVTNEKDKDGNDILRATVVARVDGGTDKTEIIFTNKYSRPSSGGDTKPDPKPDESEKKYLEVDKVWAGSGKNRPDSVTIQLLDGNTVIDTVTLGDWNGWHYSWNELEGQGAHDWNVKELEVPAGYSVSYSFDGTTFTVRNTENLIQTGQLNWPVPVLGGLGLALAVLGIVMLRRKKESGNA